MTDAIPYPKPFDQSRMHSDGQNGNCLATCLAVLLGYDDYKDVPQWESDEEWGQYYDRYTTYLINLGLVLLSLEGCPAIQGFYIASGNSVRGLRHACIYQDGKLFHDPHPSKMGLETVDFIELLADIGIPLSYFEAKAK